MHDLIDRFQQNNAFPQDHFIAESVAEQNYQQDHLENQLNHNNGITISTAGYSESSMLDDDIVSTRNVLSSAPEMSTDGGSSVTSVLFEVFNNISNATSPSDVWNTTHVTTWDSSSANTTTASPPTSLPNIISQSLYTTPDMVDFDARLSSLSGPSVDYLFLPSSNYSYFQWNNTDNLTLTDDRADGSNINLVHAIIAGTILAIVVLMTIIGNVLVLLAVFVNSHLRSTTNYFIVNLAIADLLLGTTVLPFSG